MRKVIDATDLLVGRMGTVVAKMLLEGESVDIINAEKAVISGNKKFILQDYRERKNLGAPLRGPYYPRRPDMVLRRMIRGMLPYSKPRGKEAFANLMCYIGVPSEFEDKKAETIESANYSKLPNFKYVTLKQISAELGFNFKND